MAANDRTGQGTGDRVDWRVARVGRLQCEASDGFWPDQYSITIRFEAEGRKETIRTLAHKSDVQLETERELKKGDRATGELRVRVLKELNDWVWVRLPQETLNSGPNIRVPRELLRDEIRGLMPTV